MKILVVCTSDYMAIPAALKLKNAGMLAGVVIPEKFRKRLLPSFAQSGIDTATIGTVKKDTLEQEMLAHIAASNADFVFVITFPWKLPDTVLHAPAKGCINFHPGLIPKYRGADPIFWQIKNREVNGGITVHIMTSEMDEGPVLMMKEMPVIPGETYGLHHMRLGTLASEIVMQVAEIAGKEIATTPAAYGPAEYFKRPDKKQVTIDWETQSAEDIEALVNATNPKYNGAFTTIRGMEMAILEVGFADVNNAATGIQPGTIVYTDALYGPIVACADGKFVKINSVCRPEGYLSGSKLFSLGFGVGERFV